MGWGKRICTSNLHVPKFDTNVEEIIFEILQSMMAEMLGKRVEKKIKKSKLPTRIFATA